MGEMNFETMDDVALLEYFAIDPTHQWQKGTIALLRSFAVDGERYAEAFAREYFEDMEMIFDTSTYVKSSFTKEHTKIFNSLPDWDVFKNRGDEDIRKNHETK